MLVPIGASECGGPDPGRQSERGSGGRADFKVFLSSIICVGSGARVGLVRGARNHTLPPLDN